jgi:hypothetical protein
MGFSERGTLMKLPRRNFLHLIAGVAALPAASRIARAETYPTRPVRINEPTIGREPQQSCGPGDRAELLHQDEMNKTIALGPD